MSEILKGPENLDRKAVNNLKVVRAVLSELNLTIKELDSSKIEDLFKWFNNSKNNEVQDLMSSLDEVGLIVSSKCKTFMLLNNIDDLLRNLDDITGDIQKSKKKIFKELTYEQFIKKSNIFVISISDYINSKKVDRGSVDTPRVVSNIVEEK